MYYDSVSFPGLGIGQIKLNPTAIQIDENLSIQWYAIIIIIGMITAYIVCNKIRTDFGIKEDDFLDCILYTIPIAFIGARLTYVIGDIENFHSFMDVIAIWNGGLAIYGGIIFAAISVFVICKLKKCSVGSMLDIMAIGLLIGQMIGRMGNFVNIEVYGVETTLPWAMGIGYYGSDPELYVHPLFLYEMLWNLIGFILIFGYRKLRKFDGEVFLWYMAWYGLGRGLMEPLRNPEFNLKIFGVRIMLVLSLSLCVLSVIAVIIARVKKLGTLSVPITEQKTKIFAKKKEYQNQFDNIMSDEEQPEPDCDSTEEQQNEDN